MTNPQTSAATEFDTAAVPVYPVMRLETGQGRVSVNGQLVTTRPGQSAMEAAIGLIAARAATANAGGVRVLVVDESGREFWHVIDAAGGVHDLSEEQRRPGDGARRRRQRVGAVLLAGGLVLVIALVGAVVLVARSSDGQVATKPTRTVTVKPTPTATQLPALSVPGWSSVALWGSPPVASLDSQVPAVTLAPSGEIFAVLGPGSSSNASVARLSPTTGQPLWSVKVPGEEVRTGPVLATVGGQRVVLVATDKAVSAIAVSNQARRSWPVPDGADNSAVRLTEAGPVIATSSTTATIPDAKGNGVERSVPAGATAWWPLPDGKALTVDASGRVWRSGSARVAGKPVTLGGPKKHIGAGTVAATRRVLVQQWEAAGDSGSGQVVLAGYSMPSLKPAWTSRTVPAVDSSQVRLFGDWLWTGADLVNTRNGNVVQLPQGLTVVSVDHDTVWATTDDGSLAVFDTAGHAQETATPQVDTGSANSEVQQATPIGVVSGRLLVATATDSGDGQQLYLLPADGRAAETSGASSASSPPASKSPASTTQPVKPGTSKPRHSSSSPAKPAKSTAAAKKSSS